MAHSIQCTNCGAVLKSPNAIAPGKKVKCPKCAKPFVVQAEDEEEPKEEEAVAEDEGGEEEEAPKAKKPAKKAVDDEDQDDAEVEAEKPTKKPSKNKSGAADDEAPKKKKTNPLLFVGIGAGVLLLCCCGGGVTCVLNSNVEGINWGGGAGPKAAVTATAEEMAKAIIADPNAAKEKYDNRKAEVTGEVLRINHLPGQPGFVWLKSAKKTPNDKEFIVVVASAQTPEETAKIRRLGRGQQVKVAAHCYCKPDKIEMAGATFTLIGPTTILSLTAADLAKEFAGNAAAATAKYKDKDLLVSGVVAEIRDGGIAVLKGTGPASVGFLLFGDGDNAKKLQVGQQVELRGEATAFDAVRKEVVVSAGMVVSPP